MPLDYFPVLICCLMVRSVTGSLILLIGYIYGIWMQCKSVAGKIECTDEEIWKPFKKAERVFILGERASPPIEKLRRILPKTNKKD